MDETLFHHVTGRGIVRRTIFNDDGDYARFLKYLSTAIERFAWRCHSYCLLPNHYHLLLETKPGSLARGMLVVAGSYARYFNAETRQTAMSFKARTTRSPLHATSICSKCFDISRITP